MKNLSKAAYETADVTPVFMLGPEKNLLHCENNSCMALLLMFNIVC